MTIALTFDWEKVYPEAYAPSPVPEPVALDLTPAQQCLYNDDILENILAHAPDDALAKLMITSQDFFHLGGKYLYDKAIINTSLGKNNCCLAFRPGKNNTKWVFSKTTHFKHIKALEVNWRLPLQDAFGISALQGGGECDPAHIRLEGKAPWAFFIAAADPNLELDVAFKRLNSSQACKCPEWTDGKALSNLIVKHHAPTRLTLVGSAIARAGNRAWIRGVAERMDEMFWATRKPFHKRIRWASGTPTEAQVTRKKSATQDHFFKNLKELTIHVDLNHDMGFDILDIARRIGYISLASTFGTDRVDTIGRTKHIDFILVSPIRTSMEQDHFTQKLIELVELYDVTLSVRDDSKQPKWVLQAVETEFMKQMDYRQRELDNESEDLAAAMKRRYQACTFSYFK